MRHQTRAILCAIVVCLAGRPALAQETPPVPTDSRLELARELLEASGGAASAEAQIRAQVSQSANILTSSLPETEARIAEAAMAYMQVEYLKAVPELLEGSAVAYAHHLTESELRALLVWTRSDVGQSVNAKMPAIMSEMMAQQAPRMKKVMAGIMKTAADKACEEMACTGDQRRRIARVIEKGISPPAS